MTTHTLDGKDSGCPADIDRARVSQQAAPRVSIPILHSLQVKSGAGLPREYAGHGMQVRSEEQDARVDEFMSMLRSLEAVGQSGLSGRARSLMWGA